MRRLATLAGLGMLAWSAHAGVDIDRQFPSATADAIEVKCSELAADAYAECALRYEDDFDTGRLDPEHVLRMHCTQWESPWIESSGEAPEVCVAHYGGWIVP